MQREEIEICSDISTIRKNIDLIDGKLVTLIAQRGAYVKQAAKFKTMVADVEAPKRVEQLIKRVIDLAQTEGANIVVVQAVWRAMISAFIEVEKEEFSRKSIDKARFS